MRAIAALGLLLVLESCTDPLIADAEKAVRNELRDPDSAQFTDVQKCEKPNAVMGKVNAKNGYGGYVGAEPFYYVNGDVSILSPDATTSNEDPEHFSALGKKCFSDEILRQSGQTPDGNSDSPDLNKQADAAIADIANLTNQIDH